MSLLQAFSRFRLLVHCRVFSHSCRTTNITYLVPLPWTKQNWESWNDIIYEVIDNPPLDLHNLFGQAEASIVAFVQSITIYRVKTDNETLPPVSWDHDGTCITCCPDHLQHYAWWACGFAGLHHCDVLLHRAHSALMGRPSRGSSFNRCSEITQTVYWGVFHTVQPTHSALPSCSMTFPSVILHWVAYYIWSFRNLRF